MTAPIARTDAPPAARFGVYLHVPFCRHRCDYCAFATWTDRGHLVDAYLDACHAQAAADLSGAPPVTSVFVGGGTPTLVDPARLAALVAAFGAPPDAEVTVECNPDDVTVELLRTYADAGVNRLSIGVQSLAEPVLRALGRTHDTDNVRRAAEAAHAVGLGFNVDLIYGAAGETPEQFHDTVRGAVALEPVHVSAYALTVEAGTPLAADESRHPDDDDQADKYRIADEVLGEAGFAWYEISNWAKPGHACRHNLTYWLGGDYAAVGCAAHGYRDGRRYWHVRTPDRFVDAVRAGRSPEAGSERLDPAARRLEALALQVRTGAGVPVDALAADDVDGVLAGLVTRVSQVDASWGVGAEPRLVLTEAGRMLANEVAIRLR
jgi:oxygen-independent coproporphyrinogen-3 oxidase